MMISCETAQMILQEAGIPASDVDRFLMQLQLVWRVYATMHGDEQRGSLRLYTRTEVDTVMELWANGWAYAHIARLIPPRQHDQKIWTARMVAHVVQRSPLTRPQPRPVPVKPHLGIAPEFRRAARWTPSMFDRMDALLREGHRFPCIAVVFNTEFPKQRPWTPRGLRLAHYKKTGGTRIEGLRDDRTHSIQCPMVLEYQRTHGVVLAHGRAQQRCRCGMTTQPGPMTLHLSASGHELVEAA